MENVRKLEDLPNIGKAGAADLRLLGITQASQLCGKNAYELYQQLCLATQTRHDPCVIDVFLSVVRFAEGAPALPWWHYTAERKQYLAQQALQKNRHA